MWIGSKINTDWKKLLKNYSPKADKIGIYPAADESATAPWVINSWLMNKSG